MNNHTDSNSSPVRGLRGLFRSLVCAVAVFAVGLASKLSAAPLHEVMVSARVTAEGRLRPAPTAEQPDRYVLAATASRDFGTPWAETRAASVESVARDVRLALRTNHYRAVDGDRAPTGSIIVVFHWGSVSPVMVETGTDAEKWVNQREVFALLGGRALEGAAFSERDDVFAAAREERYYLIVSAYEVGPDSPAPSERRLLWRTHASVSAAGLSQAQAMPLLCAAGAGLFGRETRSV